MENIAVHIVLPKGLRLANGSMLHKEVTFTLVSSITPFYCSVDQVRHATGVYLNKISDLAIAGAVYEASKDADSYSYTTPKQPPPEADPESLEVKRYKLFINARQNWVVATAGKALMLSIWDLAGTRGSKTLGNFSIQKQALVRDEGFPKKINDLQKEADTWVIVLKSGADIGPGGHAKGKMVQKGMYNTDMPPGRLWVVTGMGANVRTMPGYGSGQAPVKYCSSPLWLWRLGRYIGNYLVVFNPSLRPW